MEINEQAKLAFVFGFLKPSDTDQCPSSDMSSIEAIRRGWRWSIPCPTDEEIEEVWQEIKEVHEEEAANLEDAKNYFQNGMTMEQMVIALWKKVMEDDSTKADNLQLIRESRIQPVTPTKANP